MGRFKVTSNHIKYLRQRNNIDKNHILMNNYNLILTRLEMNFKSKITSILIATLILMPLGMAFAAAPQGNITIKVTDQNEQEFAGSWFLYQGTDDKGLVRRNGAKGETFNMDAGNYFITLNPKNPDYQYYLVKSENPQRLYENQSINFEVQYFRTPEQLSEAKKLMAQTEETTTEETTSEEAVTEESEEVTETEETTTEETEEVVEEEEETTEEDNTNDSNEESEEQAQQDAAEAARQARLDAAREAAAYRRSIQNVPQFNTAPANSEPAAASDNTKQSAATESKAPELAATGSPFLLSLLLPSMLGGIVIRKRK